MSEHEGSTEVPGSSTGLSPSVQDAIQRSQDARRSADQSKRILTEIGAELTEIGTELTDLRRMRRRVEELAAVYGDAGNHPKRHRKRQERLDDDWPKLRRAIDRLLAVEEGRRTGS